MIAFTWMTNKKRLIKPLSLFSLIRHVFVHNGCVHFSSSLKSDKEVKKSSGRSVGSSQDGGHLTTEWAPTMVVSSGLEEQEQDKSGQLGSTLDNTDVSIFLDIMVVFVNSTNTSTNIETTVLSTPRQLFDTFCGCVLAIRPCSKPTTVILSALVWWAPPSLFDSCNNCRKLNYSFSLSRYPRATMGGVLTVSLL